MTRKPEANIADSVARASAKLQGAGIDDARREAFSLMAFAIGKTSTFIFAHPEYELTDAESAAFEFSVERRAAREPFHYIVGTKEFYGLDLFVAPGVLIPRPETELLVEDAINILGELSNPRFLEIGTGSGCISVAILYNSPAATATAVDISETALIIAAKNAEFYKLAGRLVLGLGDVYQGIDGEFELIVSNPPYIPDRDLSTLQTEVASFEPHSALFGGDDGLDIVRRIVADAPMFLVKGGHILIEIGFGQAGSVKELFDSATWAEIGFIRDLQGIERIAKARLS